MEKSTVKTNIQPKIIQLNRIGNPVVSIVIRCKNESLHIGECINAILNQKTEYRYEIIIIDSGSTDNTLQICQNYNVSIYVIKPEEFTFGSSINLGIELSNGKYCVFLSAHAIPTNEIWLNGLVDPIVNNPNIAGCYSRQMYNEDTFLIERRSLDETFGEEYKSQTLSQNETNKNQIRKKITFSNASSCINKVVAEKYPFTDLIASEDREWAFRVMESGFNIIYNPESCVLHAHNETPQKYYQRIFINSKALYNFLGVEINILHIVPLYFYQIYKDFKYCKEKGINFKNNLRISLVYRFYYVKAHYLATRR